jgi:hypothetical protein
LSVGIEDDADQHRQKNLENKNGVLVEKSLRDNIDNKEFFREYMTINEAHEYNKKYMQRASKM